MPLLSSKPPDYTVTCPNCNAGSPQIKGQVSIELHFRKGRRIRRRSVYHAANDVGMKKSKVTVYTRQGCHLCDEAKASIRVAGCDDEFILEEISIDSDPQLRERYGEDVPVVLINGTKAFKHRVDPREFKRKLRRLSS